MGEYNEGEATGDDDDFLADLVGDRSIAEAGEYLDEDVITYEDGDQTVFVAKKTPTAFIESDYTTDVER